jgi:hypothetical protein
MSFEVVGWIGAFIAGFIVGNVSKFEMRALLTKWIKRNGKN